MRLLQHAVLFYAPAMDDPSPSWVAVERAAALTGPDATVREVSALAGGTHARTYRIQVSNPELEVILREFPPGDAAARHEDLRRSKARIVVEASISALRGTSWPCEVKGIARLGLLAQVRHRPRVYALPRQARRLGLGWR